MTPALRNILFGKAAATVIATGGGGGGAAWTPASLTTAAQFWFDAADGATVTIGTGISAWSNKGSAGDSAVQAVGSAQPTYPSSVLNGKSVARFAFANSQVLSTGNLNLSGAQMTVITVAKFNADSQSASIIGMNQISTTGLAVTRITSTAADWVSGDISAWGGGYTAANPPRAIIQAPGMATDAAFHILRADLGATVDAYIDGTVTTLRVTDTAAFPTQTAQPFLLGNSRPTGTDFMSGDIAEVIVAAAVTAGDLTKLEGYLAWKWGLQANLPGGHPYKSAAP